MIGNAVRALIIGVGLCVLALASRPVLVHAQTDSFPIETSSNASYRFGQAVTFFLQAEVIEEGLTITGVHLTVSAPEFPAAFTVELPINPGTSLFTHYTFPYTDRPFAPFTTITYQWAFDMSDGDLITMPPQFIDYIDDRFDWHSLTAAGAVVYWMGTITEADAITALEAEALARDRLRLILPEPAADPMRIAIYPSMADLRSTLRLAGRDLENGLPPADLPVVMVTAVNPRTAALDLQRTIPVEIARLRYERLVRSHLETMPGWLPAGLPALFESGLDSGYYSGNELQGFQNICTPSLTWEPAPAGSLMHYLSRTYGDEAVGQFIAALAAGRTCEEAVLGQFDLPAGELTRLWLATTQSPSIWEKIFHENGLLLGMFIGSLLLAALIFAPLTGWKRKT